MSKSDCRKFAPNCFNKNKCASCFKTKEDHSDEALENNRASRKVAKCGYLFAAPDWDFSNPINRTKRWQRRWFVLYDDGELTYSVDEHPETVPQAIIDMNRVVEVSEAEEVTGHPFSLALTAADRVHFLKGTSREESKWWFDILSMFPRTNMKTGRHKRNATFPGSKATTIIAGPPPPQQQSTAPNSPCMSKAGVSIQPFQTPPMARPRFHSQTESVTMRSSIITSSSSAATTTTATTTQQQQQNNNHFINLMPVKDTNGRSAGSNNNNKSSSSSIVDELDDIIPVKEGATSSSATDNNKDNNMLIIDKDFDDKLKMRRVIRREIRGTRSARCNSEILSSMLIPPASAAAAPVSPVLQPQQQQAKTYALVLPSSTLTAPIGSKNNDRPRSALHLPPIPPAATAALSAQQQQTTPQQHSPFYLYMSDVPRNRHYESLESLQHDRYTSPASRIRHSSSKDTPDHATSLSIPDNATTTTNRPISMHELSSRLSTYDKLSSSTTSSPATPSTIRSCETINPPGEAVRGDPDGCGLDPVTSFCSPLPDRRSSTLTPSTLPLVIDGDGLKKGWLLRLSYGGEWKKYWSVLRCGSLALFRDHAAEDAAITEDTIDLASVVGVDETDSGRSYGFLITTTDGRRQSMAALTAGIRSQWIQALRNACNQAATTSTRAEKENILLSKDEKVDLANIDQDEDESLESYSTGSSSENDDDDNHDDLDSVDSNSSPVAETSTSLPPSPPVNRTAISLVKERNRSRSSSRHRSGSPSNSPANSPPPSSLPPLPPPTTSTGSSSSDSLVKLDAAKSEIARLLAERRDQERDAKQQVATLSQRLAEKERQIASLASKLDAIKAESQRQLNDIRNLLEAKEAELRSLRDESVAGRTENAELRENLKRERSEVYKLRDVAQELRSLLDSRNDTLNQLQSKTDEVESLKQRLGKAQENLARTQERLQRGIDENEGLFARLRQMEENAVVTGEAVGGTGVGSVEGRPSGLRRSRSSTGSMPLPLQLCSRNLLGGSTGSKKSLPRLDSLSDLSNIDYDLDLDSLDREGLVDEYVELRARFERSLVEIRALKRELRQTQSALDGFEVAQLSLKQQWQAKESDYDSQLGLMAARIQDLTSKMTSADKQARQLRVKVTKSESREKRRTQSLKGRESFQLSREVEDKLVDLEHKMAAMGVSPSSSAERESPPTRARKGFEEPTKSFKMRRKSLEGGAVAAAAGDPVKILLRVDQLEQQVTGQRGNKKASPSAERRVSLPSRSPQGRPPRANLQKTGTTPTATGKRTTIESIDESPLPISSRAPKLVQDLEQCVVELELVFHSGRLDGQNLISKIRRVQQELLHPESSTGSDEGQSQLDKIQELLRVRLSELKVKRDHVRSLGKLDSAAVSQIAAEKLALELAIAEQLSNVSAKREGQHEEQRRQESLRDAHWTVQKLGWLKRKLAGEKSVPALEQSTTFGTYCAALAERLSAIAAVANVTRSSGLMEEPLALSTSSSLPAEVAHQLAEEEREMSLLFAKYKEEKLQELACLLAHETLRMGDGPTSDNNQLVEEVKVRQAWLEAQEVANKELVDSEVRQAMTRMAEVFAEDVAAEERLASALLLWPAQQLQYEQRCQVVEEVLRSEMEEAVLQLSNAYECNLKQMKAWPSTGAQPPPPDGDLEAVLSEFAEVVAQKALIDGHVAVLQGESSSQPLAMPSGSDSSMSQNISILQETESIIGVLASSSDFSFFPSALNCAEVAAILHRELVEPRSGSGTIRADGSGNTTPTSATSSSHHSAVNEEMIRQKYQDEIEQLRALTEKGMSAMESSHKRIICQLEEKHQQDLARLQVEKERALAEETQATLAALDAMRKAHEAEVQREIARFKEEFQRQMADRTGNGNGSGNEQYSDLAPERQQEMEEIRREILSLSEKYSHKCLESAALEQKVSWLGQQVTVSQRQIGDLDSRNQQLRSFIEAGQQQQQLQPDELLDISGQIKAKDAQLLLLQEDCAELQFCLRESQSREDELAALARSLGQYLRTERPLRADEVTALRHRLEDLLLLSGGSSSGAGVSRKSSSVTDERSNSPPRADSTNLSSSSSSSRFHYATRSRDLTRSPSCPRLSGFLSLAPRLSTTMTTSSTRTAVLNNKGDNQSPTSTN